MNKLLVRGIISIAVILGAIYIFTPSSSSNNNTSTNSSISSSSTHYVGLESKTSSTSNTVVPNGFTIKVSAQAQNSGILNNFENAIKNRYAGDGNIEIYIEQASGSLGGPEQVVYDVNVNGKETTDLTATRTVNNSAYGTIDITMTPIIWGNINDNNN